MVALLRVFGDVRVIVVCGGLQGPRPRSLILKKRRFCANKVDILFDWAPVERVQTRLIDDRLLDFLIEKLLRWVLLLLRGLYLLRKLVLLDKLHLLDKLGKVVAYLARFPRVSVRKIVVLPLQAQFLQIWQSLTPLDPLFDTCAHTADLLHDELFALLFLL